MRGEVRDGDERFETVTARRPVLEAALASAATAAGVTVRRGVWVTGLRTDGRSPVPRVTGVTTSGGTVAADLVVDCGGRRSALRDPDVLRAYVDVASFLAAPDQVLAAPGLRDRVAALGMPAPQYPLPGPSRADLVATVTGSGR